MQNCPALLAWYLITPTTHRVKSITAARVEISFWQTRIMESPTRNTFSDSSRCVQIIHNDYIKIEEIQTMKHTMMLLLILLILWNYFVTDNETKYYIFWDPTRDMHKKSMENNYQKHKNEIDTFFERKSYYSRSENRYRNHQGTSKRQKKSTRIR